MLLLCDYMQRHCFQIKGEGLGCWHEFKTHASGNAWLKLTEFPLHSLPCFSHLGSCQSNLLFETPIAFPWHLASHRESTHEISMEKSKEKMHFPSCLECLSAMQPVIRWICLGDSFTSPALETCPTVSLLQTSCFGNCCFLTVVLLCCFSASPVTWLSLVSSHGHLNVQEYIYGQIRQKQNIKELSLLMWKKTLLLTNTD